MKVAIEMPYDAAGKRGWIYYTQALLRELARLDKENEYLVFNFFFRDHARKRAELYCPEAPNFRRLVPRWPDSLATRLEWGLKLPLLETYLRRKGVALLHATRPPCTDRLPFVLISHDIMYVRHPEYMYPQMRWGWERSGKPGMRLARLVLVHSEYHKRELVEFAGVDERRIRVVPTGANTDAFHPVEDATRLEQARRRLSLPERFFLMIGPFSRWWCRYDTVLRAFQEPARRHPELGLVLAGDDNSPEALRLRALSTELGLEGRLRWLGRVPHADLLSLLNLALANAYPAWDTGCSINVLDSMAAGLPVIAGRVSLLPELLGEAGIWADPRSPAETEAALLRVAEDEAFRLGRREGVLRLARARRWEDTARLTLRAHREALGT